MSWYDKFGEATKNHIFAEINYYQYYTLHLYEKTSAIAVDAVSLVSCTEDADNACFNCNAPESPYRKYQVEFRGNSSSEVQHPFTIIYFKNDYNDDLVSEIFSSVANANVIEVRELYSSYKIGLKLSVGNGIQIPVNTVIITDLKTNQVIFENHSLNIPSGNTFMYDISSGSYTITN